MILEYSIESILEFLLSERFSGVCPVIIVLVVVIYLAFEYIQMPRCVLSEQNQTKVTLGGRRGWYSGCVTTIISLPPFVQLGSDILEHPEKTVSYCCCHIQQSSCMIYMLNNVFAQPSLF